MTGPIDPMFPCSQASRIQVMIKRDARHIKGVLWDFDGTLSDVDLDGAAPVVNACITAVLSLGVPLTPEEAREAAEEGFRSCGRYFPSFEQYGIDRREFHNAFYAFLDPSEMRFSQELCDGFGRLGGVGNALLSHSARLWIEAGIRRLGLSEFFPPSRILALEDCNFLRKDESQLPFRMGLDILHNTPADTAMVDDRGRNLEIPFAMGMLTILVNRGEPLVTRPNYVHHVVASAVEALELVSRRSSVHPVRGTVG